MKNFINPNPFKKVFLIVLDSFGIGYMPDADRFGDKGANTFKTLYNSNALNIPTLEKLGIYNIDIIDFGYNENSPAGCSSVGCSPAGCSPIGCFGYMAEKSNGKDTTVGHWEIAGVSSSKPLPTYPNGFPEDFIKGFEEKCGVKIMCNKPYSGTEVLKDFGKQHLKTGDLIVYTSADSVFQIAAHTSIISIEKLYEYCEIARKLLTGANAVGRVIARPFTGEYPNFIRTSDRHDFSLKPPKKTVLDYLKENSYDVISIGKIYDIFSSVGITKSIKTKNNQNGMSILNEMQKEDFNGLCFANLVDFDMLYGHRNDIIGYTKALNEFDFWLDNFIAQLTDNDLLIITADHGCDPGYPTTDHSREYTPLLIYGNKLKSGVNLHKRETFADIAKTIAQCFNIENQLEGTSFLNLIL